MAYHHTKTTWILNNNTDRAIQHSMMKRAHIFTFIAVMTANTASAACYVDYKAKQDDPLRLHYGVAEVVSEDCTVEMAHDELSSRLEAESWHLLNVISVFDEAGLAEREESAGEFYLRY